MTAPATLVFLFILTVQEKKNKEQGIRMKRDITMRIK